MRRARTLALVAAVGVVGMLAACAPADHELDPTPFSIAPSGAASPSTAPVTTPTSVPVATPTATPSTPPPPTADPTVLFTITATATATGSNHARADLVERIHVPVAKTANMASDLALLDKSCLGWKKMFPSRLFVTADITAKLQVGSPAWPTKKIEPVGADMDGSPAFSGDWAPFEAACSGGILKSLPGTIHGVMPVPSVKPANSPTGWTQAIYGFAIAYDDDQSDIPAKYKIQITNCHIVLGAVAKANKLAVTWPSHPHTYGGTLGCEFGSGF